MITKKVKAVKDIGIKTGLDSKQLKMGDTAEITFRDEAQFKAFLGLGCIQEVTSTLPPPIVRPPVIQKQVLPPGPPASQQVKQEVSSPAVTTEQINAVEGQVKISVPQDSAIHKCKSCNTILIPATDESDPKNIKHILYCPKCGKESAPAIITEQQTAPQKREISVCPKCGKRKAKEAQFCKACATIKQ